MKWFRYRFRYSYGLGDWGYIFVDDDDVPDNEDDYTLENYLEYKNTLPTYNERYQGLDWERVETVPEIVLENERKNILRRMEELKEELSFVENTKIRECPAGRYWLIKDKKGNVKERYGFFYEFESEEGCEYLSVTEELHRQCSFSNNKQKKTIFFWEQKLQQDRKVETNETGQH